MQDNVIVTMTEMERELRRHQVCVKAMQSASNGPNTVDTTELEHPNWDGYPHWDGH